MEATYYNGQQFGLNRSIRQSVTVAQYKNGESQAYFRFDDSFAEDYQYGPRAQLLGKLCPKYFKPRGIEQ